MDINGIIESFSRIQRRNLHGYFDALIFIFDEIERSGKVTKTLTYEGRSSNEFLINHENKTALYNGVVMRSSMYFNFVF